MLHAGFSRVAFMALGESDIGKSPFDIIMISYLYRTGGQADSVAADHREEGVAESLELARADPADLRELGAGRRAARGHLAQHRVVEDHVRRDLPLGGELAAQRAERLEQRIADGVEGGAFTLARPF